MKATRVIIAHNHPSGEASFTQQDREASIDLKDELSEFNIDLLDMLVVTEDDMASLKDEGGVI